MTCGVYVIEHTPTQRKYVGSSSNIHKRKTHHFADLRRNKHHSSALQNVWNAHSPDEFSFNTILICDIGNLRMYEDLCINAFDSYSNGLNCAAKAVGGVGYHLSSSHKNKISKALEGKPKSAEHRIKLSAALMGKKKDIVNISASHKEATRSGMKAYWANMSENERVDRLEKLKKARRARELARRLETQEIPDPFKAPDTV